MGLAGARKRQKFSHDPNNTAWSRSESKYGHRILQAQGWKPGQFLGARDASHTKHYTAASASHIKAFLREDNLGLGARVGAAGGEWQTTGLGGFQDLLGRLNGQSNQEVEAAQKSREDVQRKIYAERRWGGLHFVSGGLLVGDQIQEIRDRTQDRERSCDQTKEIVTDVVEPVLDLQPQNEEKGSKRLRKKEKPERNLLGIKLQGTETQNKESRDQSTQKEAMLQSNESKPESGKEERRAAKAERKRQRVLRREARATKALENPPSNIADPLNTIPQQSLATKEADPSPKSSLKARETPTAGIISGGARHVAKQRSLRHKKMAMMDSRALNEILMIKG